MLYTILYHIWWVTDLFAHRLDVLNRITLAQDVHASDGLRAALLLDGKSKRHLVSGGSFSMPYQHLYLDRKYLVYHNKNPPWTMWQVVPQHLILMPHCLFLFSNQQLLLWWVGLGGLQVHSKSAAAHYYNNADKEGWISAYWNLLVEHLPSPHGSYFSLCLLWDVSHSVNFPLIKNGGMFTVTPASIKL